MSLPKISFILLLGLFLTGFVYLPGLSGQFHFDDYHNIVDNKAIHVEDLGFGSLADAALSGISGPTRRPVAMLSFALNHYLAGLDPYWFKLTNLLIHGFNGIGLFLLGSLLLQAYARRTGSSLTQQKIYLISLAAAVIWLLHPLNLSSVLYVVQRMTSLSSLFVIWGLVLYAWARTRIDHGRAYPALILLGLPLMTILATLTKENGVLLLPYAFVIELLIFGFYTGRAGTRNTLYIFFSLVVVLPGLFIIAYSLLNPDWLLRGYQWRDFGLVERVLTQARVIWFYVGLVFLPSNARLGMFHDDFVISSGLLDPLTTFYSVLGLAVVAALALVLVRRLPLLSFAILFFLTGHVIESTVIPLELVHEHRNYLPIYGILLACCYAIVSNGQLSKIGKWVLIAWICMLAFITYQRSVIWSNHLEFYTHEAYYHPNSVRVNIMVGHMFTELAVSDINPEHDYLESAARHFERAASLSDSDIGGLLGLIGLHAQLGKQIPPAWQLELLDRVRNKPAQSGNVSLIDKLVDADIAGKHEIDPKLMHAMFEGLMGNQTLRTTARAEILVVASKYYFARRNDADSAVYLLAQAIQTSPNKPRYRLLLAELLITLGRYEDAREEIERARALDKWDAYRDNISDKIKRLRKLESQRHPGTGQKAQEG